MKKIPFLLGISLSISCLSQQLTTNLYHKDWIDLIKMAKKIFLKTHYNPLITELKI